MDLDFLKVINYVDCVDFVSKDIEISVFSHLSWACKAVTIYGTMAFYFYIRFSESYT